MGIQSIDLPGKTVGQLLDELSSINATLRNELDQMRPQLMALRELYTTYIEQIRLVLFVSAPPLPSGGYRNLPPAVEEECERAVVNVLKRRLAKVNKALGIKSELRSSREVNDGS